MATDQVKLATAEGEDPLRFAVEWLLEGRSAASTYPAVVEWPHGRDCRILSADPRKALKASRRPQGPWGVLAGEPNWVVAIRLADDERCARLEALWVELAKRGE